MNGEKTGKWIVYETDYNGEIYLNSLQNGLMEVGKVNRYTSIKKERLDTQENIKSSNMKSFINLRFLP